MIKTIDLNNINNIVNIECNIVNIENYFNIIINDYYLSVPSDLLLADLYIKDDNSGRQRWLIYDLTENKYISNDKDKDIFDYTHEYILELYSGRQDLSKYLGIYNNELILFYDHCEYCKINIKQNKDKENEIGNEKNKEKENNRSMNYIISFNNIEYVYNVNNISYSHIKDLKSSDLTFSFIPFKLKQPILIDNYYLSSHFNINLVDLYYKNDESGRQYWIIEKYKYSDNNLELEKGYKVKKSKELDIYSQNIYYYTIKLYSGRKDNNSYLSYDDNKCKYVLYESKRYDTYWYLDKEERNINKEEGNKSKVIFIPFFKKYKKIYKNKCKKRIALMLRGHIRNSFVNDNLLKFINNIKDIYDLEIYIHTWAVSEANRSWRKLNNKKFPVTVKILKQYFGDLIKTENIIIESDVNLRDSLIGVLRHSAWKSSLPLIAWKFMWYGQNRCISMIPADKDTIVINTRFDLFTVPFNSQDFNNSQYLIDMINKCIINDSDITFMTKENSIGIDNYFIGKYSSMYRIISEFNENLDKILPRIEPYQECTVYKIAHEIFDNIS